MLIVVYKKTKEKHDALLKVGATYKGEKLKYGSSAGHQYEAGEDKIEEIKEILGKGEKQ